MTCFLKTGFTLEKGKQTQCKSEKAAQLNHKPEASHSSNNRADPESIANKLNVNINLRTHPNKMKCMNELFIFQISVPGHLNRNLLSEPVLFNRFWFVLTFRLSLIEVYKPSDMQKGWNIKKKKELFDI